MQQEHIPRNNCYVYIYMYSIVVFCFFSLSTKYYNILVLQEFIIKNYAWVQILWATQYIFTIMYLLKKKNDLPLLPRYFDILLFVACVSLCSWGT